MLTSFSASVDQPSFISWQCLLGVQQKAPRATGVHVWENGIDELA